MSDPRGSDQKPATERGNPQRWDPLVTTLMILLGLPLLLPGVCSYLFTRAGALNPIAFAGFVIAFGGVAMIGFGIVRLVSQPNQPAVSEEAKRVLLLVLLAIVVVIGLFAGALFRSL